MNNLAYQVKINDCFKGFEQSISKVINPKQTCKIVLKKLRHADPPLLKGYYEVRRPSKIPQYRVTGTDYYQEVVQAEGANGKGHSQEQALASGLMELIERYSCFKFLFNKDSFKICSLKELRNRSFRLEDFCTNPFDKHVSLMLSQRALKDIKIRWYPAYTLDGKMVSLPAMIIKTFANGFAAGNSLEEALLHAICEIIERHCLTLIEFNKLETPLIDISTIKYHKANKLINAFLSLKNEVIVKDFSLGIGLPVIGVVRKISESECFITCGVATRPEEALIRALTESSQGEGDPEATKRIVSSGNYFSKREILSMDDIPDIGDKNMKIELDRVGKLLKKQNMKIFFTDVTDTKLDIPSVIVFISNTKYLRKSYVFRNILMSLIEDLFVARNYKAAEKYIQRGQVIDKKNLPVYLYYKGRLLMGKRVYREAISHFLEVFRKTKIKELKTGSLVNLCFCYLELNETGKAVSYYVKVINWYSQENLFGVFGLEKFYFNKAIGEIYKKHKLSAGKCSVADGMSAIKDASCSVKPEGLRTAFERYQRKKKKYYRIFEKAYEYSRLTQYKKAIDEAKKAIAVTSVEIDAYLLLGNCYEQSGRLDSALHIYNKALRFFPFNGSIYLGLARVNFGLVHYKEAIKNGQEVIRLGFKEGNVHFLIGICYEKTKQYKEAIIHLKKAQEVSPDNPQLDFSLSNCYRSIGQIERSNRELDKGIIKLQNTSAHGRL